MDFETDQKYYIPVSNANDSDKRNYWNTQSDKTARDMFFYRDYSEEYSYENEHLDVHDIGDMKWK